MIICSASFITYHLPHYTNRFSTMHLPTSLLSSFILVNIFLCALRLLYIFPLVAAPTWTSTVIASPPFDQSATFILNQSEPALRLINHTNFKSRRRDPLSISEYTSLWLPPRVNYRPISITSITVKIMGKFIKAELVQHLISNKLLSNLQHGFLPKRSCTTNLLEFMDDITKKIDQGKNVYCIFLDLSRAFDSIPHTLLISTLFNYE